MPAPVEPGGFRLPHGASFVARPDSPAESLGLLARPLTAALDRLESTPVPGLFSQASRRQRRGNWLGLRTLGLLPNIAGETDGGDLLFEVDSVRLVLRTKAHRFNRLMPCSRCGQQVMGPCVASRRDLNRVPNSVICRDCVLAAAVIGTDRVENPALVPDDRVSVRPAKESGAEVVLALDELELTEQSLDAAFVLLTELAESHRADAARRTEALDAALTVLDAAMRSGHASQRRTGASIGANRHRAVESATPDAWVDDLA